MALPKALRHAYKATFGGQHGQVVLADLAGQAYAMGDGAGKLISHIVSMVSGQLDGGDDDAQEKEEA